MEGMEARNVSESAASCETGTPTDIAESADQDVSTSRAAGSSSGQSSPRRNQRRLCYYNEQKCDEFTLLTYVPGNSTKARCKLCASTFSTAYNGHNAIVAHEKN